ncbi:hypothetical protein IG631_10157 [Alternaria alternata]|nr:hypothetical protein IG631_10157 [Alternaria alternata]
MDKALSDGTATQREPEICFALLATIRIAYVVEGSNLYRREGKGQESQRMLTLYEGTRFKYWISIGGIRKVGCGRTAK